MSTNRKTRNDQSELTGFGRLEKFHPFKTFLFFGIVGSTVLFLSMAFLYFVTTSRTNLPADIHLPKAFSVSTVFMLVSSYTISLSVSAYKNDSFRNLKISLWGTLLFSVVFCVFQILGWKQLFDEGFFMNSHPGIAFLYIISGIHLLHVAGGILYLLVLIAAVTNKSNDIAKSLLYLTDELQLTRLQLTTIYWHFVDILWVLLFFMFLITI